MRARIRLTHTGGTAFSFGRNADGQIPTIREGTDYTDINQLIVRYWLNNAMLRYVTVRGAGTDGFTEVRYYDPIQRPAAIYHDLPFADGDENLAFTYNPASQMVSRVSTNDAFASNTAYAVNRAYSVNGLNQYTAAGPASFAYDANGNLTSDGSTSFVYDAENRLVSASGGRNAALAYDPLGRLWQVSVPSGTTRFLYDGATSSRNMTAPARCCARSSTGRRRRTADLVRIYQRLQPPLSPRRPPGLALGEAGERARTEPYI